MTPLELAARALAENLKAQADKLGFVATDTERYPVLDGCFDMQEAARAVLEAIRVPSEAMTEEGDKGLGICTTAVIWQMMIDAALAEKADA